MRVEKVDGMKEERGAGERGAGETDKGLKRSAGDRFSPLTRSAAQTDPSFAAAISFVTAADRQRYPCHSLKS